MKKSIVKTVAYAFIMLLAFGCEKKELGIKEVENKEEQKFAVVVQVDNAKGKSEKAIIVGTKAELEASLMQEDKPAILRKISKSANVLVPEPNGAPKDQVPDLHEACWDEIFDYRDAHIEEWQALANQYCLPVYRCITCENIGLGLFVEFYVYPNSRKCSTLPIVSFEEVFKPIPFNFKVDQYESKELIEFINNAV